jgi:hypothetical protein
MGTYTRFGGNDSNSLTIGIMEWWNGAMMGLKEEKQF